MVLREPFEICTSPVAAGNAHGEEDPLPALPLGGGIADCSRRPLEATRGRSRHERGEQVLREIEPVRDEAHLLVTLRGGGGGRGDRRQLRQRPGLGGGRAQIGAVDGCMELEFQERGCPFEPLYKGVWTSLVHEVAG